MTPHAHQVEVLVRFQVEGFHRWPDAPPEVGFLAHPHRHVFHVEARKAVNHANREIEIILLKRSLLVQIADAYGTPADFGALSCEEIGLVLLTRNGLSEVRVIEDGENGAVVTAAS